MKKRLPILILLIVAAGLGAWFLHARSRRQGAQATPLFGNVDIREVNLGFRVSGRVAQVLRDEGDTVKTGDVVARLDDEPYRCEVEEARGQVGALRAHLQLLEAGNRPQEIAQAGALVREREVTAANAERLYRRQEQLLLVKAVSVQDRDDAEAAYREAEARLNSSREQLNLLEAGFRKEDIAQSKADLERAEALLA